MKPISLNAMARRLGEPVTMACHLMTGESYYRSISNRIVDRKGCDRADMAHLFAPNCRIISLDEARAILESRQGRPQ